MVSIVSEFLSSLLNTYLASLIIHLKRMLLQEPWRRWEEGRMAVAGDQSGFPVPARPDGTLLHRLPLGTSLLWLYELFDHLHLATAEVHKSTSSGLSVVADYDVHPRQGFFSQWTPSWGSATLSRLSEIRNCGVVFFYFHLNDGSNCDNS